MLKKVLLTQGVLQISLSAPDDDGMSFFTLSLYNSVLTEADMIYILDQIAFHGEQMKSSDAPQIPMPPTTYPAFVTAPIEELHKDFYVKVFQLFLKKGLFFQNKRNDPALRFRTPEEIAELMNLELGKEALSQVELLEDFEKVIHYTPHYGHPMWIFQLMAG